MSIIAGYTSQINAVLESHGLTWYSVFESPTREAKLVDMRAAITIYFMRNLKIHHSELTKLIKRDRSTILHYAYYKIEEISTNQLLQQYLETCDKFLSDSTIPYIRFKDKEPEFNALYMVLRENIVIPFVLYAEGEWMLAGLGKLFDNKIKIVETDRYYPMDEYQKIIAEIFNHKKGERKC